MFTIVQKVITPLYRITGISQNQYNTFKNPIFILLSIVSIVLIGFAYANHFSNAFQFDDSHTIENNGAIQEIRPYTFFTDATTFSTLPANQTYRPYTVLENAIDYKIANGLNPVIFHIHIFITFILLCIVICVMIKNLLDHIDFSNYNPFWALSIALIFGTLCANAETVNYIIQRAEITAALFVIIGLTAFIHGGGWRKTLAYLIFPCIGFFAKEMALVFAPLLLLYILIFEEQTDLLHWYKKEQFKKCIRGLRKAFPAFLISILFYGIHTAMRPDSLALSHLSRYNYLITQPMVICHYILTYFIPYNLSADTDWAAYTSVLDYRVLLGILCIGILVYAALKASKHKETRLFSFGVLWFLIALLPTSSFIPLSEVLNDHRAFTPYIGLTIAFIFGTKYIIEKHLPSLLAQSKFRILLFVVFATFIGGNIYGIRQRNKVWRSELSLWKDTTIKSPKNARALMNYGIALMAKGEYSTAEKYYKKGIKISPNYTVLYINMGILKNAINKPTEAENNFKKALNLNTSSYAAWYHYGNFLNDQKRYLEAKNAFSKVIALSPNHIASLLSLLQIHHTLEDWKALRDLTTDAIQKFPNHTKVQQYITIAAQQKSKIVILEEDAKKNPTAEKYLGLSLNYFQNGNFNQTIDAARRALSLKKDYPEAYNNIGIAQFHLGNYNKAIESYEKALKIKPEYQLAKNNLAHAIAVRNSKTSETQNTAFLKTADDFLNYSLRCYNNKKYLECINAAKKSITIRPNANAYSNIGAAYNQLGEHELAIEACKQALKLDPNHRLAKGNLEHAYQLKNQ